jgi:hypothetical protein
MIGRQRRLTTAGLEALRMIFVAIAAVEVQSVSSREARIILREMAAEWTIIASSLENKQSAEQPAE